MKVKFGKLFIFLFVLTIIIACGLKQPVKSIEEVKVGSIYVTSDIKGACIFVDGGATGKVTPDTIFNQQPGDHMVRVFKDGYIITPDSIIVNVVENTIANADFSLEYITNQGKIFIDSSPYGAEILVDNASSGKYTPDTVIVAEGFHHFDLYKHGFDSLGIGEYNIATNTLTSFDETLIVSKQVLIESFANSSCLPCTTTNGYLETFMASTNTSKYSLIEYFANFPSPNDPMYRHAKTYCDARISYYSVGSVPAMFIAGSTVNALDYSAILNTYNNKLANAGDDVSITLSRQTTDSLVVNVEVNELNPLSGSDWRIFVAVIEKEVHFTSPPGANGLTTFSQVFRKFLTSKDGDVLTFINNRFMRHYSSAISAEWDLDEIQIIGFIQNAGTKEVIQSSHL